MLYGESGAGLDVQRGEASKERPEGKGSGHGGMWWVALPMRCSGQRLLVRAENGLRWSVADGCHFCLDVQELRKYTSILPYRD